MPGLFKKSYSTGYARTSRRGARMSYPRRYANRPYSRYRRKRRYRKNPKGWKVGKRVTSIKRALPLKDNVLRKFVCRVGEIVLHPNQTNATTNEKSNRMSFNCSHPTKIVHWAPNSQITTRIPQGFENPAKQFFHCAQVGFRWTARVFNPSDAYIRLQVDLMAGPMNGTSSLVNADSALLAGTIKQIILRPKSAVNLSYNVSPLKFTSSDLDNAKLDIDSLMTESTKDECFLNISCTEIGGTNTATAKVIFLCNTQHAVRFMEPRVIGMSHQTDLPGHPNLGETDPSAGVDHHTHDFNDVEITPGSWGDPDTASGVTEGPN